MYQNWDVWLKSAHNSLWRAMDSKAQKNLLLLGQKRTFGCGCELSCEEQKGWEAEESIPDGLESPGKGFNRQVREHKPCGEEQQPGLLGRAFQHQSGKQKSVSNPTASRWGSESTIWSESGLSAEPRAAGLAAAHQEALRTILLWS